MAKPTLIFASFLAPTLYKTYQHIVEYIEQYIGIPTFLICGESQEDFAEGYIDAGFLCGLAYVQLARQQPSPVELIAAPVLEGDRYQREPWYFSDIVVRKESPYESFEDLRGCRWAYNEKSSHSGYNLVYYSLFEQGKSLDYFGETIESGSHAHSLRLIMDGTVDAAAIDSHMLDLVLRNSSRIADQFRVIGSFGPSTIPPVVVSSHLHPAIKRKIRDAFLQMHRNAYFSHYLHDGLIERFVPITDAHYQDIREMYHKVQEHKIHSVVDSSFTHSRVV